MTRPDEFANLALQSRNYEPAKPLSREGKTNRTVCTVLYIRGILPANGEGLSLSLSRGATWCFSSDHLASGVGQSRRGRLERSLVNA